MTERLRHDVARVLSQHILEVFAPLLREEEKACAFAEVYARTKAALECYDCQIDRTQQRFKPTRN
jgi:hypothetical protein